jgi:hypothetical protein
MSDNIFEAEGLYVTRYAGPAGPSDRRRWQFTITARYPETQHMSLDADQCAELHAALGRSLYRTEMRTPVSRRSSSSTS